MGFEFLENEGEVGFESVGGELGGREGSCGGEGPWGGAGGGGGWGERGGGKGKGMEKEKEKEGKGIHCCLEKKKSLVLGRGQKTKNEFREPHNSFILKMFPNMEISVFNIQN